MADTLTMIDDFEKIVKSHTSKKVSSKSKIMADIVKVKKINPNVYDSKQVGEFLRQRNKVLKNLTDDLLISKISEKFPLIDDSLFELKRHLQLERTDGGKSWAVVQDKTEKPDKPPKRVIPKLDRKELQRKEGESKKDFLVRYNDATQKYNKAMLQYRASKKETREIVAPLFCYVELFNSNHEATVANVNFSVGGSRSWSRSIHRLNITAKLPGAIGEDLKQKYREALAMIHSLLADCYKDKELAEVLTTEKVEVEIGAIWIPTPTSLSIRTTIEVPPRPRDPAMILKIRGKSFLITTWEAQDEEPMENLLREFTTGSLKGKLNK